MVVLRGREKTQDFLATMVVEIRVGEDKSLEIKRVVGFFVRVVLI